VKNLSLSLNIVSLLAIAVLFYLHFSGPKAAVETVDAPETASMTDTLVANAGPVNIAYLRTDSLLKGYKLVKEVNEQMIAEQMRLEKSMKRKIDAFQQEYLAAQQQATTMTQQQIEALQAEFQQKEQGLMKTQQNMEQSLLATEKAKNVALYAKINVLLKEFSKENGYSYVLGYDPPGDVMFANESMDITNEVVEMLNANYDKENAPAEAAK